MNRLRNLLCHPFYRRGYLLIGLNFTEKTFLKILFDSPGQALYQDILFRKSDISSNNDGSALKAISNLGKRNLIMAAVGGGKVTVALQPKTIEYMFSRIQK